MGALQQACQHLQGRGVTVSARLGATGQAPDSQPQDLDKLLKLWGMVRIYQAVVAVLSD